jgi:hypothetical protein
MNYLPPQQKTVFEAEVMSSYSTVLTKLNKDEVLRDEDKMEI